MDGPRLGLNEVLDGAVGVSWNNVLLNPFTGSTKRAQTTAPTLTATTIPFFIIIIVDFGTCIYSYEKFETRRN